MTSTVPAKSQPLHNFALPHLKWKKNHHSNNHHRGRSAKHLESAASPSRVASPLRQSQSPLVHRVQSPDVESVSPMLLRRQSPMRERDRQPQMREHSQPPRPSPTRDSACESSKRSFAAEKGRNRDSEMDGIGQKDGRSKLVLKLPRKNRGDEIQEDPKGEEVLPEEGKSGADVDQEASEEPVQKIWNLRPRKPIHKSLNLNGVQFKAGGPSATIEDTTQSPHRTPIRPDAEVHSAEKKEKRRRFSIALTKEEIAEDIFSLTGLKPARRPKKRAKCVQKHLDTLFPGLWLASITPDSYKVSENNPKG